MTEKEKERLKQIIHRVKTRHYDTHLPGGKFGPDMEFLFELIARLDGTEGEAPGAYDVLGGE